jgi:putative ABC transport system permease protein
MIDLDEKPIPHVYLPLAQRYTARTTLAVRAQGEPGPLLAGVRRAIAELDPALPVPDLLTASEAVERVLWAPRTGAALLAVLGLLALLLAAFGVYGITAFAVAQRSREIGIRLALGAHPLSVVGLLVQGGMAVLLAGLAAGIGLAHLSGRWISKLVAGIQGQDAAVLSLIAVLLTVVGALANVVPALRVARANPAVGLRRER